MEFALTVELFGVRIFGVQIREVELLSIRKSVEEAFSNYGARLSKNFLPVEFHESSALRDIVNVANSLFELGPLTVKNEEYFYSSQPEVIRRLFGESGMAKSGKLLEAIARGVSKRKKLLRMLESFSQVSISSGSLVIKYWDRLSKELREFRVNINKLWQFFQKNKEVVVNSFIHFAEWAWNKTAKPLLHFGIYGAAIVIVLLSVWYCVAFNVIDAVRVIGQNMVSVLKVSFPILNLAIWIFCLVYSIATGKSKVEDAWKAISTFFG